MVFATLNDKKHNDNSRQKNLETKSSTISYNSHLQHFRNDYPGHFLQSFKRTQNLLCSCDGGCPQCSKTINNINYPLNIQTKSKVSQPGNNYEQEADRIAEKIASNNGVDTLSIPTKSKSNLNNNNFAISNLAKLKSQNIQKKADKKEENDDLNQKNNIQINRKYPSNFTDPYIEDNSISQINSVINESGKPLDNESKEFMEQRFGHDFDHVRIYANSERNTKSARSLNALAYTFGNKIVFATNRYQTNTIQGKKLLAHELVHVIQQDSNSSINRLVKLHSKGSIIQRQVQSEQERVKQVNENYDKILNERSALPTYWEKVAVALNAFSHEHILMKLEDPILSEMDLKNLKNAAMHLEHIKSITHRRIYVPIDYEISRRNNNWEEILDSLDKFDDRDIPITLLRSHGLDLAMLKQILETRMTGPKKDRLLRFVLQRGTGWHPVHSDELTPSRTDRFSSQTFEVAITSLSGLSEGKPSQITIKVSVFVPSKTVLDQNKVHVFFSPGSAVEEGPEPFIGLNAVMLHGLRGASDQSEWILIGVPSRSEDDKKGGFNTIGTNGIQACLNAVGRRKMTIDALRMSAHSRGYRGLRETINRGLIATPQPERIVVFDAAYGSLDQTIKHQKIPGSNLTAYQVTVPSRLTTSGASNISLNPDAMRAIGYSRIIYDSIVNNPSLSIPISIRNQLLPLPPRGSFTTKSPAAPNMTNVFEFTKSHSAQIQRIIKKEGGPDGLMTFIDSNNLLKLGEPFGSTIYSHHLFVAELAHEVVN